MKRTKGRSCNVGGRVGRGGRRGGEVNEENEQGIKPTLLIAVEGKLETNKRLDKVG